VKRAAVTRAPNRAEEDGNNYLVDNLNVISNGKADDEEMEMNSDFAMKLEPVIQLEEIIDVPKDPLLIEPGPISLSLPSSSTHHHQPPEVHQVGKEKAGGNLRVKCGQCKKVFISTTHLHVHHRRYHQLLDCRTCQQTFIGLISLSAHATSHYNETTGVFPCSLCSKVFPTAEKCARHVRETCTAGKRHKCTLCILSFKRRSHLQNHMDAVHNPGIHPCPYCDRDKEKVFKAERLLRKHISRVHPNFFL